VKKQAIGRRRNEKTEDREVGRSGGRELRNSGTEELRNLGAWELGSVGAWELGNAGSIDTIKHQPQTATPNLSL